MDKVYCIPHIIVEELETAVFQARDEMIVQMVKDG